VKRGASTETILRVEDGVLVGVIGCSGSDQSGDQFKLNWFGKTLFDYFANLKKTMPDDNPGGLSDDEYVRVVAYIMKLNGFRAGADSLAADSTAMKLIKIGPPDSTKPRNFR